MQHKKKHYSHISVGVRRNKVDVGSEREREKMLFSVFHCSSNLWKGNVLSCCILCSISFIPVLHSKSKSFKFDCAPSKGIVELPQWCMCVSRSEFSRHAKCVTNLHSFSSWGRKKQALRFKVIPVNSYRW